MIESFTEPLLSYGAVGAVLCYFMFKDYRTTPALIKTQKDISMTLERLSTIIDERLPK